MTEIFSLGEKPALVSPNPGWIRGSSQSLVISFYSDLLTVHILLVDFFADCALFHPPLQVRTKLAHPTNFHVSEVQKRQVTNFLSSSTSPIQQSRSAPPQNMRGLNIHQGVLQNTAAKDPLLSGASAGMSPMKTSSSLAQIGEGAHFERSLNPDLPHPLQVWGRQLGVISPPNCPGVWGYSRTNQAISLSRHQIVPP